MQPIESVNFHAATSNLHLKGHRLHDRLPTRPRKFRVQSALQAESQRKTFMANIKTSEDLLSYNSRAWDGLVDRGNRWTRPVTAEEIRKAKDGDWQIILTPAKPVPREWLGELQERETLCLAGGGGQQGVILAAAGAKVIVLDNSEKQLRQDQNVATREDLSIRTIKGDMANLRAFEDQCFDLIVHPCSNSFAPSVLPVWKEAYRVLRPGGVLLSGFCNPLLFIFDHNASLRGELSVRHTIPYSNLKQLTESEQQELMDQNEPFCFGHALQDQIGGQLDAGFSITGFYEDYWDSDQEPIDRHIASFMATRAVK